MTSDVEFKYTWPIEAFLKKAKQTSSNASISTEDSGADSGADDATASAAATSGLDSKPFEINVNGINTTWNLSVR